MSIIQEIKSGRIKRKIKESISVYLEKSHALLFTNSKDLASQRILFYASLLLLMIVISWKLDHLRERKSQKELSFQSPKNIESIDTLIPMGYRLIPIEILNSESLDSILGNTGLVDLFTYTNNNEKSLKLIARKIKILRAPNNPNVFAVLCKESESSQILKYEGPFVVGVSNPKYSGTNLVNKARKQRIQYGDQ